MRGVEPTSRQDRSELLRPAAGRDDDDGPDSIIAQQHLT